jgi:glycosyltransferase involved in cell wall biosynthesis
VAAARFDPGIISARCSLPMSPELTFVVRAYNYGRYLAECLNSIFAQSDAPRFDVLVIDDASDDNTPEVLAAIDDPRLVVIRHKRNRGHAHTMNEALRLAKGEYVARIDPDDRYRPHFAAVAVEVLRRRPAVGLVYGDVALIDDQGRMTRSRTYSRPTPGDFEGNEFLRLLAGNFICSASVVARREAWLACGDVPEWLACDDWFFNLMIAHRHDLHFIDDVVADYRVHDGNHHTRVVRDRTEEPSVIWLLNRVFAETEDCAQEEAAKRRVRRRVYADHYLALADKYFGLAMTSDARRCYLRALGWDPQVSLRLGPMRRLAATMVGQRRYEQLKARLRSP